MTKQILILIALLGILFIPKTHAQTYKVKLNDPSGKAIKFVIVKGSISIQGYNGDKIIIKNPGYQASPAQQNIRSKQDTTSPKRAKGLHVIGKNGTGNTGIGLLLSKEDSTLIFTQPRMQGENSINLTVKVPNNAHVLFVQQMMGNINITNYKGAILALTPGDIKLHDITGPISAVSSDGNINVVFSHLSGPSVIVGAIGYIDVTLPASTKADLRLSSYKGKIYTDFNIDIVNNNNSGLMGGQKIDGKLNGGVRC